MPLAQRLTMPAAKASLTRPPESERMAIPVAPKPGVIMAIQLQASEEDVLPMASQPIIVHSFASARVALSARPRGSVDLGFPTKGYRRVRPPQGPTSSGVKIIE